MAVKIGAVFSEGAGAERKRKNALSGLLRYQNTLK